MAEGASAGFSVVLPGGGHEILAWVRDYEKEFPDTYWLETPLRLPPGSRLQAEAPAGCRLTLHLGRAELRTRHVLCATVLRCNVRTRATCDVQCRVPTCHVPRARTSDVPRAVRTLDSTSHVGQHVARRTFGHVAP